MARGVRKTHIGYGLIGAFIGLVPGIMLWFIIFKFGYSGTICAFLLGLGAFYGFKLLGKRYNTAGIISTTIMLLIAVWLTNRLCSTMELYIAYNGYYTLSKCFTSLNEALTIGGTLGIYYYNLFFGIVLGLFGQGIMLLLDYKDRK